LLASKGCKTTVVCIIFHRHYLRARYYDQGVGRFTQMDTWMGVSSDPVTLHKYLYANVDPANMVDPTGNFSIGSFGAAGNIQGILTKVSIASTAFDIFSLATDGDGLTAREAGLLVLTSFGGAAGSKIFKLVTRKGCNSFDGDTLVATENGLRPIKEIEIGDKVWAFNEETGEKSLQEVVHLIFGEGTKELVDITLENGELLTATTEHPFYVNNEWVNAGDLTNSSDLLSFGGENIAIEFIKSYTQEQEVYNLTVANDHTYYVGKNAILSHNAKKSCDRFKNVILGPVAKPKTFRHPKHNGGPGKKAGEDSGLEPIDSELALRKTSFRVNDKGSSVGKWYVKSPDGKSIYQYCGDKSGVYHWCGGTAPGQGGLKAKDIPSGILNVLGFGVKGARKPK